MKNPQGINEESSTDTCLTWVHHIFLSAFETKVAHSLFLYQIFIEELLEIER